MIGDLDLIGMDLLLDFIDYQRLAGEGKRNYLFENYLQKFLFYIEHIWREMGSITEYY